MMKRYSEFSTTNPQLPKESVGYGGHPKCQNELFYNKSR